MRGYCVTADDSVFLVEAERDVDPQETIKKELMISIFNWFVVRDVQRLASINWPKTSSDDEAELQYDTKMQVYCAFEVRQITLDQALNALDNPVITRAQGLGWEPRVIRYVLYDCSWAMSEEDQAEAYRKSITTMIDDVPKAVSAAESIYEQDANEFLEKEDEDEPSGPKNPDDMTDTELIEEATQVHKIIYVTASCWGIDDLFRLRTLSAELLNRGYEIHADPGYSVQKPKQEEEQ